MTSINLQPSLDGETLMLRPTVPEDWEALFAVAADPLIWALHPAHDRWQEPVFRAYFDDALASRGGLTVRRRSDGAVIGASRYRRVAGEDAIEIGWTFLARAHWGGAANRELKRLMLDHLFGLCDCAIFVVGEGNLRSRRAMEKLGGRLRPAVEERTMAGVTTRHVIYEIRKEQWREAA